MAEKLTFCIEQKCPDFSSLVAPEKSRVASERQDGASRSSSMAELFIQGMANHKVYRLLWFG